MIKRLCLTWAICLAAAWLPTFLLPLQSLAQDAGSRRHSWELGLQAIPSVQGMSNLCCGNFGMVYSTGAAAMLHFRPGRHWFLSGGIRYHQRGFAELGEGVMQGHPVDRVAHRYSSINLALGAGLAFSLGGSAEFRTELLAFNGPFLRYTGVWSHDGDFVHSSSQSLGHSLLPNPTVTLAAGIRYPLKPRLFLEVMPMAERELKLRRNHLPAYGLGAMLGLFLKL